jgi:hypothetical protein
MSLIDRQILIDMVGNDEADIKVLENLNVPTDFILIDSICRDLIVSLLSSQGGIRFRFWLYRNQHGPTHVPSAAIPAPTQFPTNSGRSWKRPAHQLLRKPCLQCETNDAGFEHFPKSVFCSLKCKAEHREMALLISSKNAEEAIRSKVLSELEKAGQGASSIPVETRVENDCGEENSFSSTDESQEDLDSRSDEPPDVHWYIDFFQKFTVKRLQALFHQMKNETQFKESAGRCPKMKSEIIGMLASYFHTNFDEFVAHVKP